MSQRCWTLQSKSKYFQYSYKDLNFISCDLAHLCVRFYLCTFLRMCTLSLMSGGGVVLAENVCQTVASAELCNSSCVASVHYCYQFRLRNSSNSWCCTVSVCHSSSGNRFKVKVFGQTGPTYCGLHRKFRRAMPAGRTADNCQICHEW